MKRTKLAMVCALAAVVAGGCNGGGGTSNRSRATAPITTGTGTGPVTTSTTPTNQATATLQPTPDTGKDTYVQSDAAGAQTNHGRSAELLVGDASTLQADFRAFVEFGLHALPPGSQVTAARLELWVTGARHGDTTQRLQLHRVIPTTSTTATVVRQTPWYEGTSTSGATLDGLCWSAGASARHTQPNVDATTDYGNGPNGVVAEATVAAGTAGARVTFDVTPVVAQWVAGAAENHGLRLSHAAEGAPFADGAKVFASSDDADPTKRPRLVIDYVPPAGASFLVLQPDPAQGKDVYIRNEGLYNNDNFGASSDLQVGDRTQSQLGDRRSYVQFDLAQLPAGAQVVKATLELYHHGTSWAESDVTVRVLRVIDTVNKNGRGGQQTPWAEGTSTNDASLDGMAWDADPASGSFPISSSQMPQFIQPDVDESTNYGRGPTGIIAELVVTQGTMMRWYAFDVTEVVKAWQAGAPNHGLRLMHAGEGAPFDGGTKHFVSSDMVHTPQHRPILRIEYR